MLNILITGANRGIGLQLATKLSSSNHIYAFCRQASSELLHLPNTTIIDQVDLLNLDSLSSAINQLPDHIDWVINNAGILKRVMIDVINDDDLDMIRDQFNVNALAPLYVVNKCLDRLSDSSKIALITSRMGSIDDNDSGSHYGYRMSKAALNMAGKSMSIDLKQRGISVGIIHPGWVQTGMTGNSGNYTAKKSAQLIIERIHKLNLTNTGTFWHCDGSVLNW